jgi:hypothetical protein
MDTTPIQPAGPPLLPAAASVSGSVGEVVFAKGNSTMFQVSNFHNSYILASRYVATAMPLGRREWHAHVIALTLECLETK